MAETVSVKASAAISAVVTRADGTVEDLGVISVVEGDDAEALAEFLTRED